MDLGYFYLVYTHLITEPLDDRAHPQINNKTKGQFKKLKEFALLMIWQYDSYAEVTAHFYLVGP